MTKLIFNLFVIVEKQLDNETQQLYSEEERIYHLVQGDDWRFIRDRLQEIIDGLIDIRVVYKEYKESEIPGQIEKRAHVVSVLEDFIKDIEGTAEKFDLQTKHLKDKEGDEIITHHS